MKKVLFFVVVMSACCSLWAQQTKYVVKGTWNEDGKTVYVIDQLTLAKIDSAVVKNGEFAMEGTADKDALLSVYGQFTDWYHLFFNDGTPVTVDIIQKTMKASPLNERLAAYDREVEKAVIVLQDLSEEMESLSEEEQEKRANELQAKAMKAMEGVADCYKKILNENRDNLIPAGFADSMIQFFEPDQLSELFDTQYVYARHPMVQKAKKLVDKYLDQMNSAEALKRESIGKPFADLSEPDVNGKMHKLSEYVGKGRWVLIDFWASWCGPCRAEMPNVVAAYEKYHAKGFDVVGLSFDNKKEAWVKAISDLKMPWIHLSDLKGWQTVAASTYNISAIPASLLVDPQGKIVDRDLRGPALEAKLKEIFGE